MSFDIPNVFKVSAVWELPFGHGQRFLGSSHGIVGRLVEKWQTSVIYNKQSGTPTTFSNSAGDTFNTVATTDIANGALPSGSVHIVGNNVSYFTGLTQVTDPTAKLLPSSLQSLSTLYAIQGSNGQILLQNPVPGSLGPLSTTAYRGLGTFTLNLQLSKAITLNREHKITMRVRADALNLLNKPIWNTPSLNIDSTGFGQITGATGNRAIVLGARIEF